MSDHDSDYVIPAPLFRGLPDLDPGNYYAPLELPNERRVCVPPLIPTRPTLFARIRRIFTRSAS